jgi:hypothetical protein
MNPLRIQPARFRYYQSNLIVRSMSAQILKGITYAKEEGRNEKSEEASRPHTQCGS